MEIVGTFGMFWVRLVYFFLFWYVVKKEKSGNTAVQRQLLSV
jgi:hypothetical protein